MLEISKNNLFINTDNRSRYGILEVLKFYDLEGISWIFLHRGESTLKHIIDNKSLVYRSNGLLDALCESNLFRIDLIVIESNSDILGDIRKYTELPIVVITELSSPNKKRNFDINKYDYSYEFFCETSYINSAVGSFNIIKQNYTYMVKDIVTNDIYDLESVKLSKIRHNKIKDILD